MILGEGKKAGPEEGHRQCTTKNLLLASKAPEALKRGGRVDRLKEGGPSPGGGNVFLYERKLSGRRSGGKEGGPAVWPQEVPRGKGGTGGPLKGLLLPRTSELVATLSPSAIVERTDESGAGRGKGKKKNRPGLPPGVLIRTTQAYPFPKKGEGAKGEEVRNDQEVEAKKKSRDKNLAEKIPLYN